MINIESALKGRQKSEVHRATLSNGVRFVVDPISWASSVAVAILIEGGVVDEADDALGITHLLEHMLFKRTSTKSALEIACEIDRLGGAVNAYTDAETLVVHGVFPKVFLAEGLMLLAQIVLDSKFEVSELETEKEVIKQEIAEADDDPEQAVVQKYAELMWPGSTLSRPIAGSQETLASIQIEHLESRLKELLVGKRLIIGCAGAIAPQDVISWGEANFGNLPIGEAITTTAPKPGSGFATVERGVSQLHLVLGCDWVRYGDADFYSGALSSAILGEGSSSRLFQKLREERGLCYDIHTEMDTYPYAGSLQIHSVLDRTCLGDSLELIVGEVKQLLDSGLTEEERDRAVMYSVAKVLLEEDSVDDRLFRALWSERYLGRYLGYEETLSTILSINREDMERTIAKYLGQKPYVLVLGGNVGDIVLPAETLALLSRKV